jgi:transcriptional regulator with XRE-family HTH domain
VARKERVPVRKNPMNVAVDAHIGLRVRGRRIVLGISQTKLADALGLTFQQVQKYERGVNRIAPSRLAAIANLLEVPIPFFFENGPHDRVATAPPDLATQLRVPHWGAVGQGLQRDR